MKFGKLPRAEIRANDCTKMIEAINVLDKLEVDVRRPQNSDYQLKVAEQLSYFPAKGTIHFDGENSKRDESGLKALVRALLETGDIHKHLAEAYLSEPVII